ncbi:MAG: hypothetical protein ACI9Y1_003513 [Lentisphaeria bacterium]
MIFEQNNAFSDDGVKTPGNNKSPLGHAITGAATKKAHLSMGCAFFCMAVLRVGFSKPLSRFFVQIAIKSYAPNPILAFYRSTTLKENNYALFILF